MKKLIELIEWTGGKTGWDDLMSKNTDLLVNDLAGGNIDDAYEGGRTTGRIDLARELEALLPELKREWQELKDYKFRYESCSK